MSRKKSRIWNHFSVATNNKSRCAYCARLVSTLAGSTGNLSRHLKAVHPTVQLNDVMHPHCETSTAPSLSLVTSPRNTKLKKPLAKRRQEEDEVSEVISDVISEDIQVKTKITKVSQPRFALSWESYQTRLCSKLNTLLMNEDFVDLTLAAGGHLVKAHQLVMSIASPYLKEIIHSSPARHPIIFLTNVSYTTLRHLLQYVYTGQVDITEDELEPFFAAAKALQIQGIDTEIDTDILKSQADTQIDDIVILPPDQNETVAEEEDEDYYEESQILIMPRSATTSSPDTKRILSKRPSTHYSPQIKKKRLLSQAEELETEELGDVMMDEDMVIVASDDLAGGANPIEFYEVSRTDDPDPLISPKNKDAESVTVQTMLLNHYKYALAKTLEGGVRRWRCIDHLKHGCQAGAITSGNTVIERIQSHNHPRHEKK